jgi:hypothetical protein
MVTPDNGGMAMHRRIRRGRLLAALAALSLLAAACGDDDDAGQAPTTTAEDGAANPPAAGEDGAAGTDGGDGDTFVPIEGVPGVTDTEIAFAAFGTNSNNPLGTCVLDCYAHGIRAYFDWRNEEGGIHGRQLVLRDVIDDELVRNLERAQDIAGSSKYFGAFSATQVASGWGTLDDAGVPLWTWSIHAEGYNRDHIWGYTGALCFDCTARAPVWYAREVGATVVASLGYGISENSKRCASANRASIERYSDDIGGVTVGYFNDDMAFGLPNGVGPEVTAMKNAGVDLVMTCMDLNGMKTLAEELRRQGMDDVVMIHPNTYNQDFVTEAGDLFEGDFVSVSFPPFEYDTGLEMQQKFKEYMGKAGRSLTELAMFGWINAHQAYEGLRLAGPDFDREKVTAARNAITEESAGGLVNPIDWTRQHVPPAEDDNTNDYRQECFSAVRIVDGVFTPVTSDETKPFLCWSNDSYDWSEPVETSFG